MVRVHTVNGPTKKGYRKGCFGSPTRQSRRNARSQIAAMRYRATSYARSYVKRRRAGGGLYDKRMEDDARYHREVNRIAERAMKRERGKALGKRTSGSQKV